MFYFGENQPRRGDFRPEVHDSDGLMVESGTGEWMWRPLQHPARTIATSFAMQSVRGFGLMQRDRTFASYEDVETRYDRRPSAWIRPVGDWGPGRVELLQFPIPDETHDNVVAYWVPSVLPAPGKPLEFAYEISWQGDKEQLPPGSWVTQTRRGFGWLPPGTSAPPNEVQYVVDFAGPALEALPEDAKVRAVVSADANGRLLEELAYRNPATKGWRMTVRVERQDRHAPRGTARLPSTRQRHPERNMDQHHSSRVGQDWQDGRAVPRELRHPNSVTAPPINRGSMVPQPWRGFWNSIFTAILSSLVLGQGAAHAAAGAPARTAPHCAG